MKKNTGVILIALSCVVPLLLWFPSLSTVGLSFRSLSQALSLCGIVLFSINFILSSRLKYLEDFFGGLNRIYIIHHLMGVVVLILLLLHPITIGLFYLKISLGAVFSIIFPPLITGFATWFGMFSILSLIILLILTLYIKLPYNVWKLTHKMMGLPLFLATIHVFFIDSTVKTNMLLRYYILGFCVLGLIFYFYKTLLGRFLIKRLKYKVYSINIINNVTEIILSPVTERLKYYPGQFVFIKFESIGISLEEHPFSLTSSPDEKNISFAVKSLGDYTETLKLLKKDSVATIEGPFGKFSYLNTRRKKQVWIAGGIGITPFISMVKDLKSESGYDIVFYYVTKDEKDSVFSDFLSNKSELFEKLKIIFFHSKKSGHINSIKIAKDIDDLLERDVFLCGPSKMMKDLRQGFNKIGIRNSRIYSEEFSLD